MKLLKTILFGIFLFLSSTWVYPKTIMLVLGSADPQVLTSRIQVAHKFYQSHHVDKVIVSGGCGAHGSLICEASLMFQGLMQAGVDSSKIYKEENAKTTVQNYIFSRVLRDENGDKIIQKGDTVFVISDHWHAISVAARFQKYDAVTARFFIEGDVVPKNTDKLDYASIFNGEPDQNKFIRNGKWLTPDAVWLEGKRYFYLMDKMIYVVDESNSTREVLDAGVVFKGLSFNENIKNSFIDAAKDWWVRQGDSICLIDKVSKKIKQKKSWKTFVSHMPLKWQKGVFNAGVICKDTLLLFANEQILIAKKNGKTYDFVRETTGADLIQNWPYAWGKSNISAVELQPGSEDIILYRNLEVLKVSKAFNAQEGPKKLNIQKIE